MSDLISRQAAIYVCCSDCIMDCKAFYCKIVQEMLGLPSVQPEQKRGTGGHITGDFIRRADAINAMANILVSPITSDDEFNIGVRRCMSSVNDIQAADVEVRHGRWILKDKSALDREPKHGEEMFCDQCGEMALGYPFWECDLMPSNFCPNCGAIMENSLKGE